MRIATSSKIVLVLIAAGLMLGGCDRLRNFSDQEHVQRAKEMQGKGNIDGSVIELKNAVSKNPKNAEARWMLGEAYIVLDQGGPAEKELKRARELGIAEETIKVPLARAYLDQGKFKEVLEEIRPSDQSSNRAKAQILKLRGDALIGTRKTAEGCELYLQSNQVDAEFVEAYWGLSRCEVNRNNLTAARAALDRAIKVDAREYGSWTVLGDLEHMQGRLAEAERAYLTALKYKPMHIPTRIKLATNYLSQKNNDAAAKEIASLRKTAPQNPQVRYLEALMNFQQGKHALARDQLQEMLRLQPGHLAGILLYGTASMSLGADEQASKAFARFLSVVPGHIHARKMAADVANKRGEPRHALELLAPILKHRPNDSEAMILAAEAYTKLREPAKAAALYEKAVAVVPDNTALRTDLALSRLASGEADRAISDLSAVIEASPKAYKADTTLASIYMQKKQWDKALQVIANLEKKLPNNPDVFNLKAAVYIGKGDTAQGRAVLNQALAAKPDYVPAAVNLARLEMSENKPDAARKHLENILDKDRKNLAAMLALAEIARTRQQEAEHVSWLEKAAKAHPAALQPKIGMIRYQLSRGQAQQALTLAREAATAFPKDNEVLELLAQTQFAAREMENAAVSYQKLTEAAPEQVSARFGLASVLLAKGEGKGARSALEETLKLDPRHLEAQSMLFGLELRAKKFAEAMRLAKNVQLQYPRQPAGYIMEGDALFVQAQYVQANRAFEQAFTLAQSGNTLIRVHESASAAGQEVSATQRLQKWMKDHPDDLTVPTYYAAFLVRKGNEREAIAQYEALVKRAPNHVLALNNLANLYQRMGDRRALETAERAQKLAPESAMVLDTLGWILLEQGQAKKAEPLLAKAAASQTLLTARYHWAVALSQTGSKERATEELKRLLAGDAPFAEREQAKTLLAQLQR